MSIEEYDLTGQSHDDYARSMSKEEILASDDVEFLKERREFYAERSIVIETMLEFPGGQIDDGAWFNRARGALIFFRICVARLDARIKALRGGTSRERREAARIANGSYVPPAMTDDLAEGAHG